MQSLSLLQLSLFPFSSQFNRTVQNICFVVKNDVAHLNANKGTIIVSSLYLCDVCSFYSLIKLQPI